ncbi:MAG: three-Cys-motif partner protein TcmP [Planctomycetia bacterium]|nr:three-Cys-motif partner protein TcmP [Planctomycetia bacterium]MCC7315822.1 three-Cys-motif partner protein TcmP [Planctomycetota bacterium]
MKEVELPAPQDDGLNTPLVGEHSKDKHWFLARYIHAFTTAMKPKKWSGLYYIDLFAGAGIERLKESSRLCWGSPLIAAQTRPRFDGLYLCEKTAEKYEALVQRLGRLGISFAQSCHGDANELANELIAQIPAKSLSLAFLDPYGLHLDYSTVTAISRRRCDLIIFFPDRVDVLRNWKLNYYDNPNSNLDRVLGKGTNWRSILESAPHQQHPEVLRQLYVSQLKKLGYQHFEYERIYSKRKPIYQLIFCSEHRLGADIWRRVAKKKPDKQDTFDFGAPD